MPPRYHPPLHADAALARRIERAEIEFCALSGSHDGPPLASLEIGGGRALFRERGSFLNKMLGLGVGSPVSEADLDAIEAFYRERDEAPRLEMCPLADADVARRLSQRGYVLQEFENELARPLPVDDEARAAFGAASPDARVARANGDGDEAWLTVVCEGFGVVPEVMRSMLHPAIGRYLVRIDGALAGGGATYQHEGVLGIFGTATIEAYRRRGVQTALVARALLDAGPDVSLAIATTAPGSTSQRTFERLGFRVVYTRAIMVLPLHGPPHGPLRSA